MVNLCHKINQHKNSLIRTLKRAKLILLKKFNYISKIDKKKNYFYYYIDLIFDFAYMFIFILSKFVIKKNLVTKKYWYTKENFIKIIYYIYKWNLISRRWTILFKSWLFNRKKKACFKTKRDTELIWLLFIDWVELRKFALISFLVDVICN